MQRNLAILFYMMFIFIVLPKNTYAIIFLDEDCTALLDHRNLITKSHLVFSEGEQSNTNRIFRSHTNDVGIENFDHDLNQLNLQQLVSQDVMLQIINFLPLQKTLELKLVNREILGYASKAIKSGYFHSDQYLFNMLANKALTVEKEYFGTYGYLINHPDANPFRMSNQDRQVMMRLVTEKSFKDLFDLSVLNSLTAYCVGLSTKGSIPFNAAIYSNSSLSDYDVDDDPLLFSDVLLKKRSSNNSTVEAHRLIEDIKNRKQSLQKLYSSKSVTITPFFYGHMPFKTGILDQKNKKSEHAWWIDNEMLPREKGLYGLIQIAGWGEYFFRASFRLDRENNNINSRLSKKLDKNDPTTYDYKGNENLLWY